MSDVLLQQWEGHDADYWRAQWSAGEIRFYQTATSTNDIAASLAAAGAPNLSLALAEEQTHGRGRGGSSWTARAGTSLLFSVVLRVPKQGSAPGCAPLRVGLAVAQAIEETAGLHPRIKWPNDVVIEGRGKVAGILCEGSFTAAGGYIVAGIGINVSQTAEEFGELTGRACSIESAGARGVSRGLLLGVILANLQKVSGRLTELLNDQEIDAINARDILVGQEVVCETASEAVRGHARGVARNGALRIAMADGLVREVFNGTVRLADTHAYPGSGSTT